MSKIERTYTIPLRKEILKVPKVRRSNKAIKAIKNFLTKHMKSTNISIGKFLNEAIWQNGMRNPPGKVEITVVKEEDKVYAELVGAPAPIVEDKKSAKKNEAKKPTEKAEAPKAEAKTEAKKPVEKAEVKTEEKEDKAEEKPKAAPKAAAPKSDEKPKAATKTTTSKKE